MKLGDTWLKQLIRESVRKALESRINEPQILDIIRTHSIKELVYYDWDKIAFGFSSDDIIEIPMRSIRVQYNDMDNVTGFSMRKYFKGAAFEKLPPIEVSFKKGKFYIEEGHHRYGYALELGLKKVKVKVEIKDNPFDYLGFYIDDAINKKHELERSGT